MNRFLRKAITTAALLSMLASTGLAAPRRRPSAPPPTLGAVIASEVTAANYGTSVVSVQRTVDGVPQPADQLAPGETKLYQASGLLRIGQASPGSVDIQSDGLTLPTTLFLQNTKIVPGAPDTKAYTQKICSVADRFGAMNLTAFAPNGTVQDNTANIPYSSGITCVDAKATFPDVDSNFSFQTTDNVALFTEWTNTTTGQVTRIPAQRLEDAVTTAWTHIDASTIIFGKNIVLGQGNNLTAWYFPSTGADAPKQFAVLSTTPYGSTSITNIPTVAAASTSATASGSAELTGEPAGQTYLPFLAWNSTDGTNIPLLQYTQAATAHGTGPNTTPYQNATWTGLRTDSTHHTTLDVQSMDSIANSATLTLTDETGAAFATQTVSLPGYSTQRLALDTLAGTHTLYSATLQMHDDTDPTWPNDTPRASGIATVTSTYGTNARAPVIVARPIPKVTGEDVAKKIFDPIIARNGSIYFNDEMTRCMLNGCPGVTSIRNDLADIYTRGIGETWNKTQFVSWLTEMVDGVTSPTNIEIQQSVKPYSTQKGGSDYALTKDQAHPTYEPGGIVQTPADVALSRGFTRKVFVQYIEANPAKACGSATTGPSLDATCTLYKLENPFYP